MIKNLFDFFFSSFFLVFLSPILILLWVLCYFDTADNGVYSQYRVGKNQHLFKIFKFRTINPRNYNISKFGAFLRKSKLDELPQLINVFLGQMSFVGPRPDVPGYYDKLEGEYKKILELKPGMTCLASIKYINEERLLSLQKNPMFYNDEVIFLDKLRMNLDYYYNRSFFVDLEIIFKTIFKIIFRK